MKDIPTTQAGRIKWVAELLYGIASWRVRIAADLSIGRTTLYRYLLGRKRPVQGIDDALLLTMARERITSQRRARQIAQAEKLFAEEMGRRTSDAGKVVK